MQASRTPLLALCALLAISALAAPSRWWLRLGRLRHPAVPQYPEWATDAWIRRWIDDAAQKQHDMGPFIVRRQLVTDGELGGCIMSKCWVRKWLPRRARAAQKQLVPFVIWQTWKDMEPRAPRFEGMNSMVQVNPEYDYALFTNEDCERFMCEVADPDVRRAYEVLKLKAGKADIWRLAIIERYGGIYVDSDVKATHPFREYIAPNASVVSGKGGNSDFHQWLLIYTPGHPFIRNALQAVARNVLSNFTAHKSDSIISMTGPKAYFFDGVAPVLRRNGCTTDNDTSYRDGLQLVQQGQPCLQMQHPEPIGFVQVYNGDYMNHAVLFTVVGLRDDSAAAGEERYTTFNSRDWNQCFDNSSSMCASTPA